MTSELCAPQQNDILAGIEKILFLLKNHLFTLENIPVLRNSSSKLIPVAHFSITPG
jgi:hypothetical protein